MKLVYVLVSIAQLLTLTQAAVKVNPLPIPRNITWNDENPIAINLDKLLLDIAVPNQIISDAFYRTVTTLRKLQWYPAATEGPISSFVPFPTGDPAKRRREILEKRDLQHTFDLSGLSVVDITVDDPAADLQLGVNETYSLTVNSSSIYIEAETVWGVLHAFSTLQQLIIFENNQYVVEGSVDIWDAPIYQHRGLMIDTGRNYLSIDKILEQIDIMSLTKLNTLHIHLDDAQSWPILLNSYPEMILDAYSAREIYTIQDLQYIVKYAKERGVRVIPEIDLPGHARAGWRQIDPNLVACGDSWWSNDVWADHTAVEPPPGQLDILNDDVYNVIEDVYNELSEIFSDNVFHVGADEIQTGCYNFSSLIQAWFQEDENRTWNDLSQYYVDKAYPLFMNRTNRRIMMWEDILLTPEGAHTLPTDVILQSWNNDLTNIQNLTARGYDVVVSSSTHFYLDCGYGGWVSNDPRYVDDYTNDVFNTGTGGSWCAPYKTWQRIYDYDFTANLTDAEAAHVIGAELALWSEQVDSTVLTQKIWPRSAALAESTWSGNRDPTTGYLRTNNLTQRIFNFREYLVALGYPASPLVPKYCIQNPHACDLYQNQTILEEFGTHNVSSS
ncbi:mannosyl-glycoprotein endo-beta-N-acetylglucosamidase [Scheffersomyces xylosifermentans]|uniref:mannosyl-glycoprotein endo-beta-N-acetylglucosamidase n=1 Tax=Scheffersomyces xylosifermentans TaxID=1304137 RepID=UPI00315D4465